MVCFQAVVAILDLVVFCIFRKTSFLLQLPDCLTVGRIFIGINNGQITGWITFNKLFQETFRSLCIPAVRKIKINGITMFIYGSVEILPFAFYTYVRFIQMPSAGIAPFIPVKPFLQFRRIMLNPSIERCMINGQTSL
jgi:hypothetical protein